MLWRKRPVVVDAVQWWKLGDQLKVYPHANKGDWLCQTCKRLGVDHGWIAQMEGDGTVCPGDWIVTGPDGVPRLCKRAAFEVTYEPVVVPEVMRADNALADLFVARWNELSSMPEAFRAANMAGFITKARAEERVEWHYLLLVAEKAACEVAGETFRQLQGAFARIKARMEPV